jgi:hypothetical protein
MNIQLLAVTISLLMFCFVLELVRRHKLTFKYAMGWLAVSAAAVFFAVFKQVLFATAAWLGFELPSNFIFFALLCGFVFLSLLLTVFLCQQNERNDTMAQKIAILESEINKLKDRS